MTSFFPAMTTMAVILSLFLQQSSLMAAAAELEEMVHMAGYGEEKLSTVLVTGSVLCQACHLHHHHHPQLRSWPISGAMVIVKCETPCKTISYTTQATTDEYGDYIIDLPSHLHGITNLENICSVKVIRIPRKLKCQPAPVKKHKPLKLSSVQDDIRTYTVGKTRFQHMASKPLKSCIRKATNTAKQIA
ncbi:5'-AMP-activated protein kinase beta-2 subunit [Hibiscus syriacus]|uniref:5'-AMP-activated protein kinase beta-2 subunit n=1 Tax=Hibiscus syriacus TaxID=106335 RepID=A0A6A2ZDS8_HIBSY|nr:uncharacterized protein LOC120146805 [Hibiscus syriacus]KAE8689817.1 5'-AMP-activated protein kinase beta-2 subunit [Hibiscus syriacus]